MTIRRLALCAALAAATLLLARTVSAGDWPQFRGPHGNGVTQARNLPAEWGPDKNVKWFAKLPAPGNSSPIVSNGRVFVTCAEEGGKKRELHCLDARTGHELWVRSVEWDKPEKTHRTNPYCGSTPAADGQLVVVWHGSAGLYCYDFDGKLQWKRDLGPFTHIWGYGSSPLIHGGTVFLNAGPGKRQFLVALDLKTGKERWKRDEPGGSDSAKGRYIGSWSTPVIAKIDGREQLLCSMPTRVVACDPRNGELLWEIAGIKGKRGDLFYTSPVLGKGVGVVMGGFGGPIVAFKLGGEGNVTGQNILWKTEKIQPQRIGSGVIVGDAVFVADTPGTARCFDLKTGKQRWQTRLGSSQWGSLVLADGKLYVTNQRGTTHVFKPNPEKFERIATNDLKEPTNSTPAITDGEIFLRTARGVYCIGRKAR